MNDITAARADLATILLAAYGTDPEVVVDTYVPEELAERHIVIQLPANSVTGTPALAGGVTYYELTLEVYLLLAGLGNAEVHDAADDFLARVLPAIHASHAWRVVEGSISNVQTIQTAQGATPGIKLSVTATLTIDPQE